MLIASDAKSKIQVPSSLKPKVINYQVNDICNARCVMCNIWKRRRGPELSPQAFRALLSDDYFSDTQHLGITGGEPTLRADLDQFYEAALDVLPSIQGGHFITNGFSPKRALDIFSQVHALYKARGVSFGGMVSLDGVGPIHNHVRGRSTAFHRASSTLLALKNAGIPVIACCTIVKANVYGLHDLLDWADHHEIEVRFRMAEFIDRLYVDRTNQEIRAFDLPETKHLVAFFHHLLHSYEKNDEVRRTYQSILSLLTGGDRLTACPYQTPMAINIDCEGRFAHCAPRGIPHSFGETPALDVIRFEPERRQLMERHCSKCIHDYHSSWSSQESARRLRSQSAHVELYPRDTVNLESIGESPHASVEPNSLEHIMLIGWYGTETAGDIAILAGIVREYVGLHPSSRFTLLSLFPHYTAVTIKDLPADLSARLVVHDYSSEEARSAADQADAVVMAGGPLMDIPQTAMVASLFARFLARAKPRIIHGCGIGPLNNEQYRNNVIAIARMATEISVRDHDSARRLRGWGIEKPIMVCGDPARGYVKGLGISWAGNDTGGEGVIRCFLRELTAEYPQSVSPEHAENIVTEFLKGILSEYPNVRLELLPMHYFPIGNDDRLFARRVAKNIASERIVAVLEPLSPSEIIERMSAAKFCIAMRFHSVVFAHTIGAPFIAIDYTNGGKIEGFLRDVGDERRCFDFKKLETSAMAFVRAAMTSSSKSEASV